MYQLKLRESHLHLPSPNGMADHVSVGYFVNVQGKNYQHDL